jgi:HSP20 family protein
MSASRDGRGRGDFDPAAMVRSEFDRLFNDFGRMTGASFSGPRMDVCETDDGIEVEAELPGYREDEVDLSLEHRTLIIRGERKPAEDRRRRDYHVRERVVGGFVRRVDLPFSPEADDISANFEQGVLHVRIAKPDASRSRSSRIPINVGGTRNAPEDRATAQSRLNATSSRETSPKSATAPDETQG